MELKINLFESASSAGSEKAKKMGLISAGFGRYRSKKGGPITHKIVGGKLVKAQGSDGSSAKLFVVEDLDFASSDDLADAVKYVKSFGLKAVGGVEQGINRNPTASVVGTKPKLVKFLKDYSGGDWDDSDIEGMIKKPYKGKSSSAKTPSKAAAKLYVCEDCDFAGSDTVADAKRYVAQFQCRLVNVIHRGVNGMPTADVVGTKANLQKFLVDYNGLNLDDDQFEEICKPYKGK